MNRLKNATATVGDVRRPAWLARLLALAVLFSGIGREVTPLGAQSLDSCLSSLHGRWRGPGTVLGRAITVEQDWASAVGGAFTSLTMRLQTVAPRPPSKAWASIGRGVTV